MKIKSISKSIGVALALGLATCLPGQAAMTAPVAGIVTLTNVPAAPTNNTAATVTNSTGTQIIPVFSGDGNHPFPVAIWMTSAGNNAASWTNTYTWANSPDGSTLATTNSWTTTLVGVGTNITTGYVLVPITNFQGAAGFGLVQVTMAGTNGMTNASGKVTYPH